MSEQVANSPSAVAYDQTEPRTRFIALLGLGIIVVLIALILAVQGYVDQVQAEQIYEKVQVPVSEDLQQLHARENAALNSYAYVDKAKGVVRLPIARAMELEVEDANAKK